MLRRFVTQLRHLRERLSGAISGRDVSAATVIALGLVALGALTRLRWFEAAEWLLFGASMGVLVLVQLAALRRVHEESARLEALLAVTSTLRPDAPLPPFTGATIPPKVARLLVTTVFERRPRLIVECGSGLSTLLLAYCVKRLGQGRVISLEHEPAYARQTKALLQVHGLSEWVEVVTAPLVPLTLHGTTWQWYDTAALRFDQPIDLLFVDGPPGPTQRHARYPAGPLLLERLGEDPVIILDDVDRKEEREIIRRWARELGLAPVPQPARPRAAKLQRLAL